MRRARIVTALLALGSALSCADGDRQAFMRGLSGALRGGNAAIANGGGTHTNAVFGRRQSSGRFDVYLGCICDGDSDSIASSTGQYGPQSRFSEASIWNRFGPFGSDFGSQSACNQFATDPPIVVNGGRVVGRLTRNRFVTGELTESSVFSFLTETVCVN